MKQEITSPLQKFVSERRNVLDEIYSTPKNKTPSIKTLEKWMMDGIAKATDGCKVESNGVCPHGCPSWLIKLGMI